MLEIEGLAALARDLDRIAGVQKGDEAQRIYSAAAAEIGRQVRRSAPLGPTGNLKKAVRVRGSSARARALYGAPAAYVSMNVLKGINRAPHAHLVEFGHRGGAKPNPYFARAVRTAGPRALAAAGRAHERLIAKAAQ